MRPAFQDNSGSWLCLMLRKSSSTFKRKTNEGSRKQKHSSKFRSEKTLKSFPFTEHLMPMLFFAFRWSFLFCQPRTAAPSAKRKHLSKAINSRPILPWISSECTSFRVCTCPDKWSSDLPLISLPWNSSAAVTRKDKHTFIQPPTERPWNSSPGPDHSKIEVELSTNIFTLQSNGKDNAAAAAAADSEYSSRLTLYTNTQETMSTRKQSSAFYTRLLDQSTLLFLAHFS